MGIGEVIKQRRTELGLSQKKLGELCEPPIDASHIRRIESGRTKPTADTIERITKALGVNLISPESDLYFALAQQLCSIIGYNSEHFTEKEQINENTFVISAYLYVFRKDRTEGYKIPLSEVYKIIDRYFEHMKIDFKAFLEEHKDDGEQNHD